MNRENFSIFNRQEHNHKGVNVLFTPYYRLENFPISRFPEKCMFKRSVLYNNVAPLPHSIVV